MPIITTLVIGVPARSTHGVDTPSASSARFASHSWPMISPTVRLRLKPCLPVEQNAQSSAQPACEEMHSVPRSSSGMKTVSIALPAPTSSSHLRVPSAGSRVARRPLAREFPRSPASASRSDLRQIGHRVEIGRPPLVDPAQQLARAKRLLAALGEERGQRGSDRSRAG